LLQTPQSLQFSCQREKRVHVALPIRVTYLKNGMRIGAQLACTYDIGPSFARVTGLRDSCRVGELVTVERGRKRAQFRVCWVGDSDLCGQFGIECVDTEQAPWICELREVEEAYQSLDAGKPPRENGDGENRRRATRFSIRDITGSLNPHRGTLLEAQLQNISEYGCQLTVPRVVPPGSDVELNLYVSNVPVTLRGKVRHATQSLVPGVEFRDIRFGDRPVLESLLRRLKENAAAVGA
jgi:hypothetical protein